MMVGETGTGKTVNISQYLQGVSKCEGKSAPAEFMPLTMTFSAQTCGLGVSQLELEDGVDDAVDAARASDVSRETPSTRRAETAQIWTRDHPRRRDGDARVDGVRPCRDASPAGPPT